MGIVAICISFQIAIIGIAYPLILRGVTELDQKYSSIIITQIFQAESIEKRFRITTIINFIVTFFYILWIILEYFNLLSFNGIYEIVPAMLLSVISLVYYFIRLTQKHLKYNSSHKLVKYFISKDNEMDI